MSETTQKATPAESDFPRLGEVLETRQGRHYALVRLGEVGELMRYAVRHPAAGRTIPGKVFLKEPLGLTGVEISLGVMPAFASLPFHHRHRQNEEVYVFLKGRGQIQIDGEVLDVGEGTAVRVAPGGVRAWRNTSAEDLFYVVVQAREGSLTAWTGSDGVGVPGPVEWPNAEDTQGPSS